MALAAASVGRVFLPLVNQVIEDRVRGLGNWTAGRLRGRVDSRLLQQQIEKALEKGTVDRLISEYEEELPEQATQRIKDIAELGPVFAKAQHAINSRKYTADTGRVFVRLAQLLESSSKDRALQNPAILNTVVADGEGRESVPVASLDYLVALLLRFAGTVSSQTGCATVPSAAGWSLDQDPTIEFTLRRPEELRFRPKVTPQTTVAKYSAAQKAYLQLVDQYRLATLIQDSYTDAAACIRAAQVRVERVQRAQRIHAYMDPKHLQGLALALRGEAQYWLFAVSDTLPSVVSDAMKFSKGDAAKMGSDLRDLVDFSQSEWTRFAGCLNVYKDVGAGIAGAQDLFKQALGLCRPGKDSEMIQKRVGQVAKLAQGSPLLVVPEPTPVF
jgi:hypothetical protein